MIPSKMIPIKKRSTFQKVADFISFPLRSITLFEKDKGIFSSLQSERFDYVAGEVTGYCLDIGCGRNNKFINCYLNGNGIGIDVYPYEGLTKDNIVEDLSQLPFNNDTFDSVTFIANIGHIPKTLIDLELSEAYRVLKPNGNIIVQTGNPLAELLIHKIVNYHDRIFGTNYDVDTIRGMHEEENIMISDKEVFLHLKKVGFNNFKKKFFLTQWGLNHLYVGWKNEV